MKKTLRLGLFALLVVIVFGAFTGVCAYYIHSRMMVRINDYYELQKAQVALAVVSFHSYYHVWPCPPGPLDETALFELNGSKDAKINTQHINFVEKSGSDGYLADRNGHDLLFDPDDSIGTCIIYESSN